MRQAIRCSVFVTTFGVGVSCHHDRGGPTVPDDAPTAAATPTEETPPPVTIPPSVEAEALRAHVTYLADDEQEGRLPGSPSDVRVQAYIAEAMTKAGLEPAFGPEYRQALELLDGVRVREGAVTKLSVGDRTIEHSLLPFSTDTSSRGPTKADLVFVGYGIVGEGAGTGDYKGIADRVKGRIVVALDGGPSDPSLDTTKLRPQSKVIAARDHHAAGFVLWNPASDVPFPNHGDVHDLALPAVSVGQQGSEALLAAFASSKNKKSARPGPGKEQAVALPVPHGSLGAAAVLDTPIEPVAIETANVAGLVRGRGGDGSRLIVVGAHMDHLGFGTSSSLDPDHRAIHNGADDNASGVAVMLEVCRALAQEENASRKHDVLCMAFAAEELGLRGSKHFVANPANAELIQRTIAMVNFDMVGRLRIEEGVTISGVGTSSVWSKLIEDHRGELKVTTSGDGYGPSDHSSFYEARVPVLHFYTGPHEDYHRPTDDTDKVNFEGAALVGNVALHVLHAAAEGSIAFDYKETNQPAGPRARFRVSLGTIPDYAAQVDGLQLAGVRAGSPAELAGLRKGDVIQKVGARTIHNLDDFMATFGELTPGESVAVALLRDGKPLELDLVPAAPQPRP